MTQTSADRPFTGAEFLESLRDGREVWIYGERVKDVTTHPAFRNSARMYNALHDPERKEVLTTSTDTGNGGFTHKFYGVSRSTEELIASRDAIAEWARISYGWMDRSPDYKASLTGTLGANADFWAPYQQNALRLVPAGSGTLPVSESRADQSAGRQKSPARRGDGRLCPRRKGD
jgi:4-hydroxyphenylacetate 3-monooxygenase